MKSFKLFISILTIASMVIVMYAFGSMDEDSPVIHASLFTIYSVFTFFVVLTYRVSLIGRGKIKWPTLGLTVLILISLFVMVSDKLMIYSLWNITMAGFILLCGDSIFQIIPKRKPLTSATKISVSVLIAYLVCIIAIGIEAPLAYFIVELLLLLTTLLLLVNYFLKTKQS